MALIHAVEPLEDAALVLRRDADAGIRDADTDAAVRLRDVDADAAALTVIFDGVFAEVIDDLIKEAARADDLRALAVDGEGDLARLRRALKVVRGLVCDSEKVDRFARDVDALVELAEADDVADERDEALRGRVDAEDTRRCASSRMWPTKRGTSSSLTMPLSSSSALPMMP